MQYQVLQRYEYIKSIEFKNSTPILNVKKINFFKEENLIGIFSNKEFRYSFDNITWSNWLPLTQLNISNIQFRDLTNNFYIQVKYSRNNITSGNISSFYLYYESNTITPPSPINASINADYLEGETGGYYLNRENHFGPFTDLEVENLGDASSYDIYDSRLDNSVGTILYLKSLKSKDNITLSESSTGNEIVIGLDVSVTDSFSYQNSNPTSSSCGGIGKDSSFFNSPKTFAETMDAIFYPPIYPAPITAPFSTFTLTGNSSTLFEVSTNLNIAFTSTFNRGSIYLDGVFQDYRSGFANTYNYIGSGLPTSVASSSSSNSPSPFNYSILSGYNRWYGNTSYDEGPQPLDSKGNPYSTPLSDGSTSLNSVSLEGVYPIYATSISLSTLTKQVLYSMITGNNIILSLVAQPTYTLKQRFSIAQSWINSRPLIDIETYDTITSSWKSTGLTQWDTSIYSQLVQGNNINYILYIYNGVNRSSVQIRLKF